MLFEQLRDVTGVALGLRGLSSYYHRGTGSQEEKRSPPSEARRGASALGLRALLRLEATEIGLGVVHEAHGIGDRAVARLLGYKPVHLLGDSPVGRMSLGTGT